MDHFVPREVGIIGGLEVALIAFEGLNVEVLRINVNIKINFFIRSVIALMTFEGLYAEMLRIYVKLKMMFSLCSVITLRTLKQLQI